MISKTKYSTLRRVGLVFALLFLAVFAMACREKKVEVTEVTLNKEELALYVGKYEVLEATVAPENATDKTITWSSSKESVATVKNGVVEAVAPGEAIITAKCGDKEAQLTVTVTQQKVKYTVKFDARGGSKVNPQEVLEGEKAIEPQAPTREGYEFDGWYVNEQEFDFSKPIEANVEVYARWLKIHAITYEVNGGTEVEPTEVLEGERPTKPVDPIREGYTFEGWFTDAALTVPFDFKEPATKDITLYAKWEIITYTVTIPATGEVQEVDHGEKAQKPEIEPKEGFLLAGFYTDAAFTEEFDFEEDVITQDLTIYVKWDIDPEVYTTVEFETGGAQWSFSGVQMFFAGLDEVASYKINYFNADNTQYLAEYPKTVFLNDKNSPKTALSWVRIVGINRNAHGLYEIAEIIAASGTTTDSTQFDYALYAHDGNPAGYAFLGTLEVGQLVTLEGFDVVTGEPGPMEATLRVYAKGTPVDSSQCVVKVNDPLPTPTKAGYLFAGWYDNDELDGEPVETVEEPIKLYAKWVETITVSFGDDAPEQELPKGGKPKVPAIPTKADEYFRGWFADEELTTPFDFDQPITEDVQVYAKWDEKIVIETDDVDYKAVWNKDHETYYIKITVPEEDLDAETIKSIKVIEEAGERLEEPEELVPDSDKVMWFGVSKFDSDLSYKAAGLYAFEVVRAEDDSVYVFTFNYQPNKVTGLREVVYAEGVYEVELDEEKEVYNIKVIAAEGLDADSVKSITLIKEAGELLEEPVEITPKDNHILFAVAKAEEKDLEYKAAGEYAYHVVRNDEDNTEFILKYNYQPNQVTGLHAKLAEVDYNAVYEVDQDTYYIEIEAHVDLDAENVETIKVLAEAGKTLEEPKELTPTTDKTMLFAVAKGDGNLGIKAAGRYTYEVTLKDETVELFEFYYRPENVRQIVYIVTLDANGGTIVGRNAVSTYVLRGETVEAPMLPHKDGYKFVGWHLNDKEFDFTTPITNHTTLVAKWELFSINYELDGGKFLYTEYEEKEAMKVAFLRDFYDFVEAGLEEGEEMESLEVFMHGEGNEDGFDGTWHSVHKEKLYAGERIVEPNDELGLFIASTKYHAKWLPFFDNIERFVKSVNATQKFYGDTFVGFIRIRDYMIELPARGNHLKLMPQVPEQVLNDQDVILPVPHKDGHEFAGWYLDADHTGDPITKVPAALGKDVTLYAKWTPVEAGE